MSEIDEASVRAEVRGAAHELLRTAAASPSGIPGA